MAKGYNDGQEVTQYSIQTTKYTQRVVLSPDRLTLSADGQDLSFIAIHLEDEDGNIVQTDDRKLTVTVEGEGKLLGLDTGDLRRENSFAGNQLKTYFGRALATVQSNRKPGQMKVNVAMEGSDETYSVVIVSK
jgi:beta-galactosidase